MKSLFVFPTSNCDNKNVPSANWWFKWAKLCTFLVYIYLHDAVFTPTFSKEPPIEVCKSSTKSIEFLYAPFPSIFETSATPTLPYTIVILAYISICIIRIDLIMWVVFRYTCLYYNNPISHGAEFFLAFSWNGDFHSLTWFPIQAYIFFCSTEAIQIGFYQYTLQYADVKNGLLKNAYASLKCACISIDTYSLVNKVFSWEAWFWLGISLGS